MTKKWMPALFAGMIALTLAASLAGSEDLKPMVVTGPTGTLHILQGVPCGEDVDLRTAVIAGRLEITPADGIDLEGGRKRFALTRLILSFAPFSVRRECRGVGETRDYTEESAELAKPVSFTASLVRPDVYSFSIPKAQFLIYLTATVNRGFDRGYNARVKT